MNWSQSFYYKVRSMSSLSVTNDARNMANQLLKIAKEHLVNDGFIEPVMFFTSEDGDLVGGSIGCMMETPGLRDELASLMRSIRDKANPAMFMMVTEAWMATVPITAESDQLQKVLNEGAGAQEDRIEAIEVWVQTPTSHFTIIQPFDRKGDKYIDVSPDPIIMDGKIHGTALYSRFDMWGKASQGDMQ